MSDPSTVTRLTKPSKPNPLPAHPLVEENLAPADVVHRATAILTFLNSLKPPEGVIQSDDAAQEIEFGRFLVIESIIGALQHVRRELEATGR
jgi:hypothetical protein